MPVSCAASGCKSRYTLEARKKGITFHRFPRSNPILLDKWRIAMKRATSTGELWMPSRYQRLCSLHFQQNCFDTTGQTKRLRDDVIPSIFNFPKDLQMEMLECKLEYDPMPDVTGALAEPEIETKAIAVQTVPAIKEASNNCVQLQDHLYFIPDVETLKKKLQASEFSRAQKEKELRNAKEREKRLRQACPTVYKTLRKRKLLSPQLQEKLQLYGDIPMDLFKKPASEYSAQQRLFSLTLQLHDPTSYRYLGQGFKLPLPGPRKLRQWLKTDCDRPGLNSLVLEALLKKKEEHPEVYSSATLAVGIMPIEQHVIFNSQEDELVGFVNLGKSSTAAGSQEVADEALMFFLVGTSGNWEAPVAYFFVKSLTADAQKQFLLHVLHELQDNAIAVDAIALDRNQRNEEMCSLLGCDFFHVKHLRTYFSLPNSDKRHYIVFNVHKELNNISDLLQEAGSFQSPHGLILWRHIDDVLNFQVPLIETQSGNVFPVEMITPLMKIKLTVNKLSCTVADMLSFLQEFKPEMFESSATITFIQIINQLFSVLMSRSPRGKSDNSPVDTSNIHEKLYILQKAEEYLLSLNTNDNCPLYERNRGWHILGLLVNISSFMALLPYLLQHQKYLLTHRFSTDHLQRFFSRIRKSGGSDESPTALQVRREMKNLLSRCGLLHIDKRIMMMNEVSFVNLAGHRVPPVYEPDLQSLFQENAIMLPDFFPGSRTLETVLHNTHSYIAGCVVRRAFTQLSCAKCRCALVTTPAPIMPCDVGAYHLLQLKHERTYFVPSDSVIKVIETAENELSHILKTDYCDPRNHCLLLQHRILSSLGAKNIFNLNGHITETEEGIDNHHFQLLRLVTFLYYRLLQPHITKLTQSKRYKACVKQILTRCTGVFDDYM
uniref:THAP-type domain-containing protein n=1 Tax=Leptobrachium leishanense TaxID=445787 RepID=A0A8C5PNA0_9ANUR